MKSLRQIRLLGALLCGLLLIGSLSGCSARKLAYHWADRLLGRQIGGALALDGEQRRRLDQRLKAMLAWHRREELPRYAALVHGLRQKLEDGTDQGEVRWLLGEITAAVDRFAERLAPEAGAVLAELGPRQVEHLDGEIRRRTKERFERLELQEAEYVRHGLHRAEKGLQGWLGSVTPAQRAVLEAFVRETRPYEVIREQSAQRNRREFIAALQERVGAAPLADMMRRLMVKQEIHETPAFQQADQRGRERVVEVLVALDRLLTPEQRQHLLHELDSLHQDLSELAAETGPQLADRSR